MLYYSGIDTQSIVDGEGVRLVIFFSGCKHACDGCHNKETWGFKTGKEFTQEVKDKIYCIMSRSQLIKGITLSGGDPMFSPVEVLQFVLEFKSKFPDKDIWLYTGFELPNIYAEGNSDRINLLQFCDYVVDGKFDYMQTKKKVLFRGSSNQKIWRREGTEFIDVSQFY